MKKLMFLLIVVFSNLVWADDHDESGPLYAFYHLQVGNPFENCLPKRTASIPS